MICALFTLRQTFDTVDTDGSGNIGREESNQMMMANDGPFNIFMNVSKKLALAAKKERLKQWSMVPHLENKQAKVKEQKKAAIEEAKIPVLVGQRSKLLWQSNTRLDLFFFEFEFEFVFF